mmetsp:Transcript_30560/g.39387  ORF Transcript_30560/g.39387 Transcript_30560/m.39387 type:complete len:496 (+) Transcript_30560:59-1546(+)
MNGSRLGPSPRNRTPPRSSSESRSLNKTVSRSQTPDPHGRTTKVGPSSVFDLERSINASEKPKTPVNRPKPVVRSASQPRVNNITPPRSQPSPLRSSSQPRGSSSQPRANNVITSNSTQPKLQQSPLKSASQPRGTQMARPMLASKRSGGGVYIPGRKVEVVEEPTQWLKSQSTESGSIERERYLAECAREDIRIKEEKRKREREERKKREEERAARHREKRKEKQKEKKRIWKEREQKKNDDKKARKQAKIDEKARKAAEAAALLKAEEEEEEEEESESDDDVDHAEEAALEKAEAGDFVGDVCVVCAFGLPKVDYWGSCDSYVKPWWDGKGERELLNGIKWDLKKNRGRGAEVPIHIDGKDLAVRNSQTPRFDFHFQVDFRKADPDAELVIELWDWDKVGEDDLVSQVVLSSLDVRQRCCTTIQNRKQGKFNLKCKPGATGKELKWGVGNLTLQFKLAEQVNYMAEAQKKAFGRTRQQYISQKIKVAREEYQV